MKIVFGGKFESAVIRALDEINRPDRNRSTHPYYMGLNRDAHKLYFDRAATFIAIANSCIIAQADWVERGSDGADDIDGARLGLIHAPKDLRGAGEWDQDVKAFASVIVEGEVLSPSAMQYISDVSFQHFDVETQRDLHKQLDEIKRTISVHYLCRLFLQVRCTQGRDVLLVLDEEDIKLIAEIRDWLSQRTRETPFEFPDINGKTILGQDFAGGLFNFSPKDARSVIAIREDTNIRKYASDIRYQVYKAQRDEDAQRALIKAMRETYRKKELEGRVKTVFEVAGFVVKPLHYIPIVGEVLTAVEDGKDLLGKIVERDMASREWHLLAAKATEINVEDYLRRKSNIA